jgi:hypothetical protein
MIAPTTRLSLEGILPFPSYYQSSFRLIVCFLSHKYKEEIKIKAVPPFSAGITMNQIPVLRLTISK